MTRYGLWNIREEKWMDVDGEIILYHDEHTATLAADVVNDVGRVEVASCVYEEEELNYQL